MTCITSRFILITFTLFTLVNASRAAEPFSTPPKPVESSDVGSLRVDRFGKGGKALIFIPGLAGGPWVWHDTIARFTDRHTVYVLTLPGFDGRPTTNVTPLFDVFKRDFWSMLVTKDIDKPIIIGHSLGGTLAIALAQEHPEKLAGVIAVDGLPAFPSLAGMSPQQREAMAARMSGEYATYSSEQMLEAQKRYMATVGTNKPALVEPAARMSARSNPKAVGKWLNEVLKADLRSQMGKIAIPLLEIMPHDPGAGTPFTQEQSQAFYQSLLAKAPKATVVPIAPSRHFVMLDQPDALHDVIARFITDVLGYTQQAPELPTGDQFKAAVDKSVAPLLTGTNALQGVVVGIVRGGKKQAWGYGKVGADGRTPDGDTLFPVFSVTKPLTALLLARLSVEGKLRYDDVAIRLKEKPVTFRQLITHTSGLPLLAANLPENSIAGLRTFLNEYSLDRQPGSRFEYSTVGFGALGMCLAERCESRSFEDCLREKVLSPLEMSSSAFELPVAEQARFAGEAPPAPRKDGPNPFNASGGLISSVHDLLQLVSANLKAQSRPQLEKAIALTQQTDPKIKTFPGSIGGLGWFFLESQKRYFHSGMGSDFRAFIAFDLKSDCGVVILTKPGLPPSDSRIEMAGFSLLGAVAGLRPGAEN